MLLKKIKSMNECMRKNKCEDYLDKIRNTDIFDKYEFIKENKYL